MNEYTLNVDIKRDMSSVVPTFAQGDSATLYFRVFDDGESYDYTNYVRSETRHRLPNSKQVIVGAGELVTIDGEKLIKYVYDGKEMVETGFVDTNLTIYTYSTTFSVRTFPVHIYDNLHSETLGYIEYLQKLLEELELLKQGVINQMGGINSLGTVSSVNDILPDYNGNVTIPNASNTVNGLITSSQFAKLSSVSSGANFVSVVDNFDSNSPTSALSAKKGKELNENLNNYVDVNSKNNRFKTRVEFEDMSINDSNMSPTDFDANMELLHNEIGIYTELTIFSSTAINPRWNASIVKKINEDLKINLSTETQFLTEIKFNDMKYVPNKVLFYPNNFERIFYLNWDKIIGVDNVINSVQEMSLKKCGNGNPEGVIDGDLGDFYTDINGNNATLYYKASGDSVDTGWKLVSLS